MEMKSDNFKELMLKDTIPMKECHKSIEDVLSTGLHEVGTMCNFAKKDLDPNHQMKEHLEDTLSRDFVEMCECMIHTFLEIIGYVETTWMQEYAKNQVITLIMQINEDKVKRRFEIHGKGTRPKLIPLAEVRNQNGSKTRGSGSKAKNVSYKEKRQQGHH